MTNGLLRNVRWSAIAGIGRFIIAGSTFAIAGHLVAPAEMAHYGLGWSISMLGLLIAQEGAGQALISMPDASREHYAAANALTLLFAILINICVWCVAQPVSVFYQTPELESALKLGAAFIPFMCLSSVDLAILQRNLEFRLLAIIQLMSTALASASAIIAIVLGFHVVGLFLIQGAIGSFAFVMCRIGKVPHQYRRFSLRQLSDVFKPGRHMAIGGVTSVLGQNVPQFMMAKFVTSAELGVFVYCLRLVQLMGGQLSSILANVLYPTFAKAHRERDNVGVIFSSISPFITIVSSFPLVVVMIIPEQFLYYYGGPGWVAGAKMFFWLALMQYLYCFGAGIFAAFKSVGLPAALWMWNIFVAVVNFVAMWIGLSVGGGIGGVIALAVTGLFTPIPAVILLRRTGVPVAAYLADACAIVASAAVALGAAAYLRHPLSLLNFPQIASVVLQVVAGSAIYFLMTVVAVASVRRHAIAFLRQRMMISGAADATRRQAMDQRGANNDG